jgi:GNAT superfamily N-acetyltransferase
MKTIRPAHANDIEFLARSSFDDFKKSVPFATTIEKLQSNLQMFCFNHDAKLTVVSVDNELCGYLAASLSKFMPWNSDLIAIETLFYVFPKYRKTKVAHMLMNDFIYWAIQMDCTLAIVTSRAVLDGERVGKFYKRFGFEEMDTNYTLRLSK